MDNTMSIAERRADAAADLVAFATRLIDEHGATRTGLEAIKPRLADFAAREELFPAEHFSLQGERAASFRLWQDSAGRIALYAVSAQPGHAVPPHNHLTWAVICGVRGDELNTLYERTDRREVEGVGELRLTGEHKVSRGDGLTLLPDDFHAIQAVGKDPFLHLHLYGRSLEGMGERIIFPDPRSGKYRTFAEPPVVREPRISALELKKQIGDGRELAILDVRETGVFSRGHLLFAVSLPLSQLELRVARLVPRKSVRIVLCDDDEPLAQRAATKLRQLGYNNLSILDRGLSGWREAGFEIFTGTNVYSKAFSEVMERELDTPRLNARKVNELLASGRPVVVLDSRTEEEFRASSVPGALSCPGGELVRRVKEVAATPDVVVVVNCAGRTRSIIGTQTLVNAGLPNQVVALENGTFGWHLAGLPLASNADQQVPVPGPETLMWAREAARRMAQATGVRKIGASELEGFCTENDRTLYVIDVRTEEEFLLGHLRSAVWVPGGQLLQTLDEHVATTNSRIVVVDSEGVRALVIASWLTQMGWAQAWALSLDDESVELIPGPAISVRVGYARLVPAITPAELQEGMKQGDVVVIDVDPSTSYETGHIPGAWFAIRSRLASLAPALSKAREVVVTSSDGVLAQLAAADLAPKVPMPVRALEGGTRAWQAEGHALSTAEPTWAHVPEDEWRPPQTDQEVRDYFQWELDLVEQIRRDGDARYRITKFDRAVST